MDDLKYALNSLKIPPHSKEAEQAVLGGLMLDNAAFEGVSEFLTKNDFYHHEHRLIFQALDHLILKEIPLDVLTVSELLKSQGNLEAIGGEAYLFELAKNTPSTSNIGAYTNIVREQSILRQLLGVANKIAETAFKPEGRGIDELLDEAEKNVFHISSQGGRNKQTAISIQDLLAKTVEKIDHLYHSKNTITGLSTGFTDLDEKTAGLQPSDLIIVAGRPSMGKTAFAMNIVEDAAIRSKLPVLVFSMEMPGEALAMRLISSLSRINQQHLRTGHIKDQDWSRITSAVSTLATTQLFIDDTPALSPMDLRTRARRVVREQGQLGLIMVDYLQLMQVPGHSENRVNEVSYISRSLKALAKELNCPVLALSQLSRGLEQRSDRRPVMSDLRESGAIEQDADVIMFIYRDEVYNAESPYKGTAEIIIGKQRNGPIGTTRLTFLGEYTKFEDYAPESSSDF